MPLGFEFDIGVPIIKNRKKPSKRGLNCRRIIRNQATVTHMRLPSSPMIENSWIRAGDSLPFKYLNEEYYTSTCGAGQL